MRLCKKNISRINATATLVLPEKGLFSLPEKVLQFGTGVLLRGLPDLIINNANNKNCFNGRIVMVKSTGTGDTAAFAEQDCLYTVCVRGITNGKKISGNYIVSSINRVLSATNEWDEILACAANENMQVIISNTTEVGLVLTQDDVGAIPPLSFPGKLLAFLYHRYNYFNGDTGKGLVIIPTELIPDNGKVLLSVVLQLARQNNMELQFIEWIQKANYFCSSLVDRIVPGKLPLEEQAKVEAALGYTDELMIMSEPYKLWAIECSNEKVREILSFASADSGVIIADDINKFRELKLRLLNGSHTFSCGLAHLAGFTTVKEAMENKVFSAYIKQLMFNEIVPAICTVDINDTEAKAFAGNVLDRFSNNFIKHKWLSITMQYSSKMNTRNVAVIQQYITLFKTVPLHMALGMAAHILFMKSEKIEEGNYYGLLNGNSYFINDSNAESYTTAWEENSVAGVVEEILNNKNIWQASAAMPEIFKTDVIKWLNILIKSGANAAMEMAVR